VVATELGLRREPDHRDRHAAGPLRADRLHRGETWQPGTDENGRATGATHCPRRWHLDRHATQLPFEVHAGEVALLDVPGGKPEDWALRQMRSMLDHVYDPEARELLESWKPAILRAEDEFHRTFLAAIRQARDGYDLYPLCTGPMMTAVVRTEGNPFPWYGNYKPDVIEPFRASVPATGTSGTGFGAACVETRRGAFHLYLVSDADRERTARAAGEWMARENLQGEIDVIVTGRFVDIGTSAED
jgi:hypothetical protein